MKSRHADSEMIIRKDAEPLFCFMGTLLSSDLSNDRARLGSCLCLEGD